MSATRTIPDGELLTPRVRSVGRRWLFWVGIGTALLLLLAVVASVTRSSESGRLLDPEDAAPTGGRALANVLADRGVDVVPAARIEDVVAGAGTRESTTVLVHDVERIVDEDRIDALLGLADRIVLVEPELLLLDDLAPELGSAGAGDRGVLEAGDTCRIPAAERAGSILADGSSYELLDEGAEVELCFLDEDGLASVAQLDRDGATVTVVGAVDALTNAELATEGDAALAIGLLGQTETLVWYQPDASDIAGGPVDPGELLPAWASPVAVLLALVGVLAAMWHGRRLGPLVIENLPVVVPASETMEGRARLYARSSARLHALDALRIGTVGRIATRCGLPRSADVGAVADAAAAATGRDPRAVRDLLVDATPHDDGDLVRRSDDLLELERAVERAVHPR